MTLLSPGNLAIYSVQLLLVVIAAAIGARVVAPSVPRTRFAFWRAVVVACLLLPLWPVRRIDVVPALALPMAGETLQSKRAVIDPGATVALDVVPWLLLFGAAARGAWLIAGLRRLRQLRLRGRPARLDRDLEGLKQMLAPHVELRWDEQVEQPLTFGLRRPVVLLPRRLTELSPEAQRAVVCHELVHVARRDWLWTLIEEAVQTAFWFHPAMWWALGEVQRSREETVDESVVAITGIRGPYMHALMMFAETRPAPAPAIPSVRRRHLAARITQLSQETVMSPARIAFVGVALAVVVVGASAGVVSALPLRARAQDSAAAKATGPRLKTTLDGPRHFEFKNTPLTDVLAFLGMVNGFVVTYEKGLIDLPNVSLDATQVTVEEFLDQLLTPHGLSYKVIDEHSILVERMR